MSLGVKAARQLAAIQAENRRATQSVRLVAVGMLELAVLALMPFLIFFRSETFGIGSRFSVASAALICLVLVVPVLFRGSARERVLGLLLCPFPILLVFGLLAPLTP